MTQWSSVLALAGLLSCGVLAAACGNADGLRSTGPSPLPTTPFPVLNGSYQMTIVANGCQNSFPNAYRTRTYG